MSEVKNPQKVAIDAALGAWPAAERSEAEWEANAKKIEARIAAGGVPADDDLLRTPLAPTPEEVQNSRAAGTKGSNAPVTARISSPPSSATGDLKMPTQTTERNRDRRSLQDLAKLASSPSLSPQPPKVAPVASDRAPAVQDDSGIVDLKMMATLDPQAEERAKTTPLASSELFDDDAPQSKPSPSLSRPQVASAVAAPSEASAALGLGAAAVPASRVSKPPSKRRGVWLGTGGVAAIAFAAGAAIFMVRANHRAADQAKAAQQAPAVSPSAPSPAVATAAPAATDSQAVASADTAASPADNGVDPSKLPMAQANKASGGGGSYVAKPSAKPSSKSAPAVDPALVAKDLPPSPDQKGSLADALKQAAGPTPNAPTDPAAGPSGPQFAAGSVPQKPSQGAVTGALGAVLQGARACLSPDDAVSRATVVFDSSGAVSSVVVTGPAAGKAPEACIKSWLGKAKVQPFAQPTYTAHVTIRPN